jgi:hypothetical protein
LKLYECVTTHPVLKLGRYLVFETKFEEVFLLIKFGQCDKQVLFFLIRLQRHTELENRSLNTFLGVFKAGGPAVETEE